MNPLFSIFFHTCMYPSQSSMQFNVHSVVYNENYIMFLLHAAGEYFSSDV